MKLKVPPRRANLVSRSRLFDMLERGVAHPLTLISAPAGFGKTTLIADWIHCRRGERQIAWVSLDADDDDVSRFVSCVSAALEVVVPSVGSALGSMLGSVQYPAPQLVMTALLNELADSASPVVLLLDDYHVIKNSDIHAALGFVVDNMPDSLRLVVTTREEPRLPLARWRARQQLMEIGLDDLRFSLEEAKLFLGQTMGLELDGASAQALEMRTEGWIAGLQLAALALQHRVRTSPAEQAVAVATTFSGGHRYVIDYLAGEILSRQSDDTLSFLRQTAILDGLCASLCDAVTGRDDSNAVLARLEQANLFLIRLDEQREWYRYHQLFGEFLRSTARSSDERLLHQRASAWYEAQGRGPEAFKHALAAEDTAAAVRLFRANVESMLSRGQVSTLLAWLNALPDGVVAMHGDLVGYKAWLSFLRGETPGADAYSALSGVLANGDIPSAHRGMLLTVQSYLAVNWTNPADAVPLAREALAQLGDSTSFFRVMAHGFLGQAHDLCGDRAAAARSFRQAIALGEKFGIRLSSLSALIHLVPLMCAQGQLREAMTLCRDAAERSSDGQGNALPVAGLPLTSLAAIHYELDELESARDCLAEALALCQRLGMVYFTLLAELTLARVHYACGNREAAWTILAAARLHSERSQSPRRSRLVALASAELQLRDGQVAAAARTLSDLRAYAGWASETERFLEARMLLAQGDPLRAAEILSALQAGATNQGETGTLVLVHILQSLCKSALRDRPGALQALEQAVSLAAASSHRRVFIDEGAGVAAMLGAVRHAAPDFVDGLAASFRRSQDAPPRQHGSAETLSKTQLQVLTLLNRGLTNQEIANELRIGVGTIRWHLNHIFGKLQVRNRTAAIVKARELRLL